MPTGRIKFYNRKQGFGFIKLDDSDLEIFVHATGLVTKKNIQDNDRVSFDIQEAEKGPSAINVKKIEE